MALTPSAKDPNRKNELKRRKEDPGDFGVFDQPAEKPKRGRPPIERNLKDSAQVDAK